MPAGDLLAFLDGKVGADRNRVAGEHFLGLRIDDDDLRVEVLLVLGDDHALLAGFLVGLRLAR